MKRISILFFYLIIPFNSIGQWNNDAKDRFLKQCYESSATSFNKEASGNYCNCMFEKVEAKYSSEAEAAKIPQSEIDTFAKECVNELMIEKEKNSTFGAWWSAEIRKQFIAGCNEKLKGSSVDAEKYCTCVLDEMILLSPDPLNASNIKDADLFKLAEKCLGSK